MRTSIPLSDCLRDGRRETVSDVHPAEFRNNLRRLGALLLGGTMSINCMLNGSLRQRVIDRFQLGQLPPLCSPSS